MLLQMLILKIISENYKKIYQNRSNYVSLKFILRIMNVTLKHFMVYLFKNCVVIFNYFESYMFFIRTSDYILGIFLILFI